jgi:hypothetical protein
MTASTKTPALTVSQFKRREDAEVYSCRFAPGGDWAILILHEDTGTVAIHSSHGDWTFSWPRPGRGDCSLREFVTSGSYDYLAGKFTMGVPDRLEWEATEKMMREKLADHPERESLIEDLEMLHVASVEQFLVEASDELKTALSDDFSSMFKFDRPREYYWLRDSILPALSAEIQKLPPAPRVPAPGSAQGAALSSVVLTALSEVMVTPAEGYAAAPQLLEADLEQVVAVVKAAFEQRTAGKGTLFALAEAVDKLRGRAPSGAAVKS